MLARKASVKRTTTTKNQKEARWKAKLDFLGKFAIMVPFQGRRVERIAAAFVDTKLSKGEIIFQEGEPAAGVYFIQLGLFELKKKVSAREAQQALKDTKNCQAVKDAAASLLMSPSHNELIMNAHIGPGGVLGADLLFLNQRTPYTCWVVSEMASVLFIRCHDFTRIFKDKAISQDHYKLMLQAALKPLVWNVAKKQVPTGSNQEECSSSRICSRCKLWQSAPQSPTGTPSLQSSTEPVETNLCAPLLQSDQCICGELPSRPHLDTFILCSPHAPEKNEHVHTGLRRPSGRQSPYQYSDIYELCERVMHDTMDLKAQPPTVVPPCFEKARCRVQSLLPQYIGASCGPESGVTTELEFDDSMLCNVLSASRKSPFPTKGVSSSNCLSRHFQDENVSVEGKAPGVDDSRTAYAPRSTTPRNTPKLNACGLPPKGFFRSQSSPNKEPQRESCKRPQSSPIKTSQPPAVGNPKNTFSQRPVCVRPQSGSSRRTSGVRTHRVTYNPGVQNSICSGDLPASEVVPFVIPRPLHQFTIPLCGAFSGADSLKSPDIEKPHERCWLIDSVQGSSLEGTFSLRPRDFNVPSVPKAETEEATYSHSTRMTKPQQAANPPKEAKHKRPLSAPASHNARGCLQPQQDVEGIQEEYLTETPRFNSIGCFRTAYSSISFIKTPSDYDVNRNKDDPPKCPSQALPEIQLHSNKELVLPAPEMDDAARHSAQACQYILDEKLYPDMNYYLDEQSSTLKVIGRKAPTSVLPRKQLSLSRADTFDEDAMDHQKLWDCLLETEKSISKESKTQEGSSQDSSIQQPQSHVESLPDAMAHDDLSQPPAKILTVQIEPSSDVRLLDMSMRTTSRAPSRSQIEPWSAQVSVPADLGSMSSLQYFQASSNMHSDEKTDDVSSVGNSSIQPTKSQIESWANSLA